MTACGLVRRRRSQHAAGRANRRHERRTLHEPKTCTACTGDDKDKPIVGLVIIQDLKPDGDRYKGGSILDPEDGKIYKAELWVEDGKLKVRGYLGVFHKTQTWAKGIELVRRTAERGGPGAGERGVAHKVLGPIGARSDLALPLASA